MTLSEKDKQVIEQYKHDEEMMVLIFAQWCINNDVDPVDIYKRAYPKQQVNKPLLAAVEKTLPKAESEVISTDVVQHVLQLFGNEDLVFAIEEIKEKRKAD